MRRDFVTVDCHEVCHGDILAGVNGAAGRPVGSILFAAMDGGYWIYGDEAGREIDRRPMGGRVQVVRQSVVECRTGNDCALPGVSHSTTTSPDDCPPHGITRGPRGLYVVVE